MKKQELIKAIEECENGLLIFNLREHRSFLFKNKWYPLRAVVNRAMQISGENELTTDRALLLLSQLLHYTRIDEVVFKEYFPVPIDQSQKMAELKKVSSILSDLTD
jgi:hypothetical protein